MPDESLRAQSHATAHQAESTPATLRLTDPTPADRARVVIVDDEPLARDCIRLALEHSSSVDIVAECTDGASAVDAIREHAPDVVFLDVQMPGMDGFDVIHAVGVDAMPPVVFVTAYDAHAIRAFEVHALDYVLKPFDDARIAATLARARAVVRERREGELGRRLAQVLESWRGSGRRAADDADEEVREEDDQRASVRRTATPASNASFVTRFAVRDDGRVRFVAAGDVDWIESDSNYIVLHVGTAVHRIRSTLRDVAEELDPRRFVRIHRSAIVNVERIRELQPWFGGDYVAILRSGEKLKVSRQRAGLLLRPMA